MLPVVNFERKAHVAMLSLSLLFWLLWNSLSFYVNCQQAVTYSVLSDLLNTEKRPGAKEDRKLCLRSLEKAEGMGELRNRFAAPV